MSKMCPRCTKKCSIGGDDGDDDENGEGKVVLALVLILLPMMNIRR